MTFHGLVVNALITRALASDIFHNTTTTAQGCQVFHHHPNKVYSLKATAWLFDYEGFLGYKFLLYNLLIVWRSSRVCFGLNRDWFYISGSVEFWTIWQRGGRKGFFSP